MSRILKGSSHFLSLNYMKISIILVAVSHKGYQMHNMSLCIHGKTIWQPHRFKENMHY